MWGALPYSSPISPSRGTMVSCSFRAPKISPHASLLNPSPHPGTSLWVLKPHTPHVPLPAWGPGDSKRAQREAGSSSGVEEIPGGRLDKRHWGAAGGDLAAGTDLSPRSHTPLPHVPPAAGCPAEQTVPVSPVSLMSPDASSETAHGQLPPRPSLAELSLQPLPTPGTRLSAGGKAGWGSCTGDPEALLKCGAGLTMAPSPPASRSNY